MLSCNTFLETRIQSLHDGIFMVAKVLCVLVQRMLKTSRCLYTAGNFKQNIGNLDDLIYDHDLPIKRFDANLSFG